MSRSISRSRSRSTSTTTGTGWSTPDDASGQLRQLLAPQIALLEPLGRRDLRAGVAACRGAAGHAAGVQNRRRARSAPRRRHPLVLRRHALRLAVDRAQRRIADGRLHFVVAEVGVLARARGAGAARVRRHALGAADGAAVAKPCPAHSPTGERECSSGGGQNWSGQSREGRRAKADGCRRRAGAHRSRTGR